METWTCFLAVLFFASCIDETESKCSHGQWQCTSGDCVLRENVCNTFADCPDASDESVCKTAVCEDFLFQCLNSRQCLSREKICNGQEECEDGSNEEQPECDREDFVHVDNSKHGSVEQNNLVLAMPGALHIIFYIILCLQFE